LGAVGGSKPIAELFMTKQPVTVMLVDPQPGSQVGPWIFQLQPDAKKIVWVNLPPEIQTELFSGYGQYGVSSVYPLLMIEKKSPAYVQASLGAIAGRLLSRVEPWSGLKTWQQQVQAAKLELVEFNPAHRRLAGQPVKEIVKMSWQKIWSDQTSWRAKKSFLYEFKTSLGWYWFIQQARLKWQWSSQLSDLIATAPKAAIDCPVVVVNASQSQGLAKQIGTLLTNTGYEVIRISAETAIIEDSALWLDPNQADKCRGVALSVGGAIPTTPELCWMLKQLDTGPNC
jgi:hypothetical protein